MRLDRADGDAVRLRVHPRAARNAIVGWREGVLRISVTAPPVDGEANHAVSALLARVLGVRPSAVAVIAGLRGRDKLVRIEGWTAAQVRARLEGEGR
jgi:uncharacterized protein (TIGR00251 family)